MGPFNKGDRIEGVFLAIEMVLRLAKQISDGGRYFLKDTH